jgi:hypothetical protein
MTIWTNPFGREVGFEVIGYLGDMLSEHNELSARDQFDRNYQHGGGWSPFAGFNLDREDMSIQYPGDPPYHWQARTKLREEEIYFYPHAWVMIVQPTGEYEIARMD